MATTMRAKMIIERVVTSGDNSQVGLTFRAVTNGTPEDNTFSKFTPSASLDMTITNPALIGQFKNGDVFYVDFTPAV